MGFLWHFALRKASVMGRLSAWVSWVYGLPAFLGMLLCGGHGVSWVYDLRVFQASCCAEGNWGMIPTLNGNF